MSAAAILDDLRQRGAVVSLDAGAVRIRAPKGALPAVLVEAARVVKPELVVLLTEDARADFEERAAIMEFDGGVSRAQAEAAAKQTRGSLVCGCRRMPGAEHQAADAGG